MTNLIQDLCYTTGLLYIGAWLIPDYGTTLLMAGTMAGLIAIGLTGFAIVRWSFQKIVGA